MALAASHASMAAPMQAMAEISFGVLLVIGLLTRPVAFVCVLVPRQSLDIGVWHIMDMGTAGSCSRMPWPRDRTRRPNLGHRRVAGKALARRSVVVMWAGPSARLRHHPHPE